MSRSLRLRLWQQYTLRGGPLACGSSGSSPLGQSVGEGDRLLQQKLLEIRLWQQKLPEDACDSNHSLRSLVTAGSQQSTLVTAEDRGPTLVAAEGRAGVKSVNVLSPPGIHKTQCKISKWNSQMESQKILTKRRNGCPLNSPGVGSLDALLTTWWILHTRQYFTWSYYVLLRLLNCGKVR